MSTASEASFKVLESSYVDVREDDLSSLNSVSTSFHGNIEEVLQYFYVNGLYTDISFHVRIGDGYVHFACHKLVLSLWSPVFARMFFKMESAETVEVSGIPPSAFEVMIKYCYGIETELKKYRNDVNFLLNVYKGASEYKIKGLRQLCCEIFSCALPTEKNVFELLDAAAFIGSEALKHRCYKVLQTQTRQILESPTLSGVSHSVVNIILDMKSLSLESEFELIDWVFIWGSQEHLKLKGTSFRDVMTPFLSRLNFLSLKPEEFGKLVSKHKEFFTEKEGFAIFMNIVCAGSWPLPQWVDQRFNRCFHDSDSTISMN